MKHAVEPNSQETTIYGYRQMMKNHIIPKLGIMRLQSLKADHLQEYYTEKLESLSPNTVLKQNNLMQTAFSMAEKHDIINRAPIYKVRLPKAIYNEIKPLMPDELEAAYNIENDKHALLLTIVLAVLQG